MKKEPIQNKTRIHTVYKAADGSRLPSVTTVLSELAKPALIGWAWGLGIKGIDYRTFRDDLAEVGTLAHKMILAHLKKETLVPDEYSKETIDRAETAFLKYLEWEGQHAIEPQIIEEPFVSEVHGFGGTPDFLGMMDGKLTLIDFKTSKAIYDDFFYQLAAYAILHEERGSIPENYRILRIGRIPEEAFEDRQHSGKLEIQKKIFLACLEIYKLKKLAKGE
jgi:hypothetical protein